MKEEGSAPGIDEFTFLIEAHAGFRTQKFCLFGVFAIESAGDFLVGADGVAAEHRAEVANGRAHVFEHGAGRQTRGCCGTKCSELGMR